MMNSVGAWNKDLLLIPSTPNVVPVVWLPVLCSVGIATSAKTNAATLHPRLRSSLQTIVVQSCLPGVISMSAASDISTY